MDPDPQFFKSFAHKTLLDRFILFAFAAREFPIAAETVLEVTLSDQELPVLMNDRTTDLEKFHYFSFEQRVGVLTGMILSGKTM